MGFSTLLVGEFILYEQSAQLIRFYKSFDNLVDQV